MQGFDGHHEGKGFEGDRKIVWYKTRDELHIGGKGEEIVVYLTGQEGLL